jgi:hypothetical protein
MKPICLRASGARVSRRFLATSQLMRSRTELAQARKSGVALVLAPAVFHPGEMSFVETSGNAVPFGKLAWREKDWCASGKF